MYYLLFIIFICVFCFFISRNGFIKSTGLSSLTLNGIFLVKAVAAIVVGLVTKNTISDSWGYNEFSHSEYELLVSNPGQFFYDFVRPDYMTWHDLPENIMLKLVAILDLITRGNYYINSLFFSLAGFLGSVALYKVFKNIYADAKWELIAGCFLLPSLLVFTSTIQKDTIIFCMLGLFCHAFYFSLRDKLTLRRIVIMLFTAFIITTIRSYVMIVLLPALFAWLIAEKSRIRPWLAFAGTYLLCLIFLMIVQAFSPNSTPLKFINSKQSEFFSLGTARSQVSTDTIYPTLQSHAQNIPQAFSKTLIQPYLFQFRSMPIMNCFALEMHLYVLLFLLMLIFYKRPGANPFIAFSIVFAFSLFLLIGYIVPNMGAITRYRSIFLPFLITPLLCHINWQKIRKLSSKP